MALGIDEGNRDLEGISAINVWGQGFDNILVAFYLSVNVGYMVVSFLSSLSMSCPILDWTLETTRS
jgi:hypothetical protein